MKTLLFSILFFNLAAYAKIDIKSPLTATPLIELFSSEGCSSCPPAESWLAAPRDEPNVFKNFIPINFHVDYWNRLGWSDRFSRSQFTDRQHRYAQSWKVSQVYTPAFVVNGEDKGSSGEKSWLNQKSTTVVGELHVKEIKDGEFEIQFQTKEKKNYEVHVARLGNGLESKVTSGENSGRTLRHNFVVLDLQTKPLIAGQTKITLAKESSVKPKSLSIAVWVTELGQSKPIQAVGSDWK